MSFTNASQDDFANLEAVIAEIEESPEYAYEGRIAVLEQQLVGDLPKTALKHGPVTADILPLLTRQSMLSLAGEVEPYIGRSMNSPEYILTGDLGDELRCTNFIYIGERDEDGWIAVPEGGWTKNPAPRQMVIGRYADGWTHGDFAPSEIVFPDPQILAFRLTPDAASPAHGISTMRRAEPGWLRRSLDEAKEEVSPSVLEGARFDAGLLGGGGGGDVDWWQDYIRTLLADAHEFYNERI